jgi:hypothetical protein
MPRQAGSCLSCQTLGRTTNMTARLRVEYTGDTSPDVVHRFRNYGEDLVRALAHSEQLSLEQVDQARTAFVIVGVSSRSIGSVTRQALALSRRHGFADQISVNRA